jgi:hypothetical protein
MARSHLAAQFKDKFKQELQYPESMSLAGTGNTE